MTPLAEVVERVRREQAERTEQVLREAIGHGYDVAVNESWHLELGTGELTVTARYTRVWPGGVPPPGSVVYLVSLYEPPAKA